MNSNSTPSSPRRPGLRARSSSLFTRTTAPFSHSAAAYNTSKIDSPFAAPPSSSSTAGFPWDARCHKHSASMNSSPGAPMPSPLSPGYSTHSNSAHGGSRWRTGNGMLRRLVRRASQPLRDVVQGSSSRASSVHREEDAYKKSSNSIMAIGKEVLCCGRGIFGRPDDKIRNKGRSPDQWIPGDGESGFFQDDEGFQVAEALSKKGSITYPDFSSFLPTEISSHIFSYVDDRTLLTSCALVSSRWNELSSSSYVWKRAFTTKLGFWNGPRHAEWKRMYRALSEIERGWAERQTGDYKYLKGHKDSVYCVQFDDNILISGSRDRCIRIWDMKTLQCTATLGYSANQLHPPDLSPVGFHTASILCLQYDSEILVTGSSDQTCIVWSLATHLPIMRLRHHTEGVLDVCFNKTYIVSCSKDTKICVWDRATGALVRTIQAHSGPVNAISMQGNYVASASGDTLVKLWDIETGECVREFTGHRRGLACVQLSEDRQLIVSGGNDFEIRVWDCKTGDCLRLLKGHTGLVRTLHVDSRNRRIVSGSYDKTVAVWNLDTGARLINMKQYHTTYVLTAKADYRRIISASQDKNILVVDFGAKIKDAELLEHVFDKED